MFVLARFQCEWCVVIFLCAPYAFWLACLGTKLFAKPSFTVYFVADVILTPQNKDDLKALFLLFSNHMPFIIKSSLQIFHDVCHKLSIVIIGHGKERKRQLFITKAITTAGLLNHKLFFFLYLIISFFNYWKPISNPLNFSLNHFHGWRRLLDFIITETSLYNHYLSNLLLHLL